MSLRRSEAGAKAAVGTLDKHRRAGTIAALIRLSSGKALLQRLALAADEAGNGRGQPRSGGDLEQLELGDEDGLGLHVASADVPNLPLPDHRHRLVTRQHSLRRPEAAEATPGLDTRFTRRWSCSTMLLRSLARRSREERHNSPLCFIPATAHGYAGFLSTVTVSGSAVCGRPWALRMKRFAAAASRVAESRKPMVAPRPSTAWYRYIQRPFTRT